MNEFMYWLLFLAEMKYETLGKEEILKCRRMKIVESGVWGRELGCAPRTSGRGRGMQDGCAERRGGEGTR